MVSAGKFRRYHGSGWRQLFDLPTIAKNFRDFFRVLAGTWQSYSLLKRLRPSVVFIKGGYVGVPVGVAAALLGVPYVTHDSDSQPGLANRLVSRWAAKHAVAMPVELYPYREEKTIQVGVPVSQEFQLVTPEKQRQYKQETGIPEDAQFVVVTGGGLGAMRINQALLHSLPQLLKQQPRLYVAVFTGRKNYRLFNEQLAQLEGFDKKRVIVRDFAADIYRYMGAADIVITRAGATSLAELAAMGKASIVIPNPLLAGGHQVKNAKVLAGRGAAMIVSEDELRQSPERLGDAVIELLSNPQHTTRLAGAFHTLANPSAADELAAIIVNQAKAQE